MKVIEIQNTCRSHCESISQSINENSFNTQEQHKHIFRLGIGNRNRNRNLKTSKALLKSQAHQGTSLFTSAATNQRGVSKGGSREAQVRIPEYQEGTE